MDSPSVFSFTSAGAQPHYLTGYTIVGMMFPPRPTTPDNIESLDSAMTTPPESSDNIEVSNNMESSDNMVSSDGIESVAPTEVPDNSVLVAVPINAWEFNAMRLANDPVFLARQWFSDIEVGPSQLFWRDMFQLVAHHHRHGPMVICETAKQYAAFELGRCEASMSFTWELPIGYRFS